MTRNVFSRHRRYVSILSCGKLPENRLKGDIVMLASSTSREQFVEISGPPERIPQSFFSARFSSSTGYSSIHGERPSAEYAKMRKQSLESEFGLALGTYGSRSFSIVYRFSPFLALYRAAVIAYYGLQLAIWQLVVQDMKRRAIKFEAPPMWVSGTVLSVLQGFGFDIPPYLVNLIVAVSVLTITATLSVLMEAPLEWLFYRIIPQDPNTPGTFLCEGKPIFLLTSLVTWFLLWGVGCQSSSYILEKSYMLKFLQLGQALSTRPDVLHPVYCHELAKLQDQIPPFPTSVAIKLIETQLGVPISNIFADISPEPIAAASLGQVYRAHLHTGELVAVKVQRPGMSLSLTLDALLFNMIGGQLKRFAKARKDLLVAVNEMVRHMFDEIDYVLEGKNAERFALLYGYPDDDGSSPESAVGSKTKAKNSNFVRVPKIFWDLTRRTVLTMEWVNGIKLTDQARLNQAGLNRSRLLDLGLYCSLRQLLEVGFFHADPHPGNLVATTSGSLAYFDFGMMGDIPRHFRVGLIQVIIHFVNRDSLGLANDFLSLGFIPEGVDVQAVADALKRSFGGEGTRLSQDFQGIMNQLYDVMYEFDFSLPPDYALVIRALGSLEGTAKVLDPDFKVVESAYPFIIARLLADPNPDMRKILRELLIHNDGSIRWNRLERLIAAISEQSDGSDPDTGPNSEDWKSFDIRAVVSATEDLLDFILSDKGLRVRIFLLRDIVTVTDTFLEDEIVGCRSNKELKVKKDSGDSKEHGMLARVTLGFRSLRQAVNKAPELWSAMVLRLASRPEFRRFLLDVVWTLVVSLCHKMPQAFWRSMSSIFHRLADDDEDSV